jgi:hypothetical protein
LLRLEGVETKVIPLNGLHPSIKLGKVSRPRDPQRWAFALSAPRPQNGFSVHNNSLNNLVRGINERVFYTDNKGTLPQRPRVGGFSELFHFDEAFTTTYLRPWTLEEFVDSYTGRQYNRYRRAADSLAAQPLSSDDATVATFIKCEKINFHAKADPAPRIIQPRDPRFNAAIGVFIKPLEKLIYKNLGKLYKYPCVAKGFDVFQTGDIIASKWGLFENPCAISLDASRFDQHVSVEALKWTHSTYLKFNDDPEFKLMLNMMLRNKGRGLCADGRVSYVVDGCRMSGDMDTALGNCLLMVAMTYSYCRKYGIDHEVMDNGDDITVIMDASNEGLFRSHVKQFYADLGFTMKVEPTVYVLEEIEFCQMHPVFDGSMWRMVRNPICLAKDLVCTTGQTQVDAWLEAIGLGGISLASGLPIYQSFYVMLSKFGRKRKKSKIEKWHLYAGSGFARLAGLTKRRPAEITTEARQSFEKAFGLNFSRQYALEDLYTRLQKGPLGINYTSFDCLRSSELNCEFLF